MLISLALRMIESCRNPLPLPGEIEELCIIKRVARFQGIEQLSEDKIGNREEKHRRGNFEAIKLNM